MKIKMIFVLALTCIIIPQISLAQQCPDANGVCTVPNFLGVNTIEEVIAKIITFILGIAGTLALLYFMYGGFTWITSGGETKKIDQGRDAILWAAIGLVVIFSSYILSSYIFKLITPAS